MIDKTWSLVFKSRLSHSGKESVRKDQRGFLCNYSLTTRWWAFSPPPPSPTKAILARSENVGGACTGLPFRCTWSTGLPRASGIQRANACAGHSLGQFHLPNDTSSGIDVGAKALDGRCINKDLFRNVSLAYVALDPRHLPETNIDNTDGVFTSVRVADECFACPPPERSAQIAGPAARQRSVQQSKPTFQLKAFVEPHACSADRT